MLKNRNLSFRVTTAHLDGCMIHPEKGFVNGVSWMLHVGTEADGRSFLDEFGDFEKQGVGLNHDRIRLGIRSWKQIEGCCFKWSEACDDQGQSNGSMFVFEHGSLHQGEIRFGKREGREFELFWTGLGDMYCDDEFDERVPFELNTRVRLNEIRVEATEHHTEESIVEMVRKYIDPDEYTIGPFKPYGYKGKEGAERGDFVLTPK